MKNIVETHERVKDFDWSFSYSDKPKRYPTRYKVPPKTKDPFRHLIRDYCSMEQEKDDRQYGAMSDVIARSGMPGKASERWMEIMKLVLPITCFGEYAAMKSCGQLIDTVDNAELRQGYLAQTIDEVRHVNQQAHLARYFAKHAPDPQGFAQGFKLRSRTIQARAGQAALSGFFNADPIEGAINLQVVTETAYTNPLFVAVTEIAAANGDETTPTVFLSVQSDEARHMANGYSTLAAVVSNPDNLPHLEKDFDRAFWRQHNFLDPFLGAVYDYFQENRSSSYLEKWEEWIADDWAGAYIAKLEPFGLKAPRWFDSARANMPWVGHTAMMLIAAAWPMMFWRFDPMTERDFEWFEKKYPGWYNHFGSFWEDYARIADPKEGAIPMQLFDRLPPLCNCCHMPCALPRPDIATLRVRMINDRKLAFCSEACEHIFREEPHRYLGNPTLFEEFDGVDMADFIEHGGFLRADGKTLIAQPTLKWDKPWTIDDIRALKIELRDPLRDLPVDEVGVAA